MKRIFNWFFDGQAEMQAYYTEQSYTTESVRLFSSSAPGKACKVDIRSDGISIMSPHFAQLSGEQNLEELAGNFSITNIDEGSVITCHIIDTGGLSTISIQLEMEYL